MRAKRMSKRGWMGPAAGGVAGVAVAVGIFIATQSSEEPTPQAQQPTVGPITAAEPSESPSPVAGPSAGALEPGDLVATIAGETVSVYDSLDDEEPRELLSRFSYYGNVRTFMGLETSEVDGVEWIHVQLPEHPNNTTAWIKADEVTVDSTDLRVDVYLDEREVDLVRAGEVELTSTAVIGADESPTPLGTYFIADPVDFTANPTGTYGAYALGLSAYSETLETFKGALPQIALHGTNSDQYFGEAVSNGCIRLPDDVILELAEHTELGTPVVIHQSRDAASA